MTDRTIWMRINRVCKAYDESAEYVSRSGVRTLSSDYDRAASLVAEIPASDLRRVMHIKTGSESLPECIEVILTGLAS